MTRATTGDWLSLNRRYTHWTLQLFFSFGFAPPGAEAPDFTSGRLESSARQRQRLAGTVLRRPG